MGFLTPQTPIRGSMIETLGRYSSWGIRTKLLLTLIPLVLFVLFVTGYAMKVVSGRYLGMALERTTKLMTMGQAQAIGQLLEEARQDILFLAKTEPSETNIRAFLTNQSGVQPHTYREIIYIGVRGDFPILCLDTGREVVRVQADQIGRITNNPLMLPAKVLEPQPETVTLFGMAETSYLPGALPDEGTGQTFSVFRLVAPVFDPSGALHGFWVLSLDGKAVREVLSLYNSPKSPLAAFPRTAELRYSFMFDAQGWILFQSATPGARSQELSTELARSGLTGDHGMPGHAGAFRPTASNEAYWRMVVDVQNGQTGIETVDAELDVLPSFSKLAYSMGYAPVYFSGGTDKEQKVVGGVAFMDKTRMMAAAEYRIYDMLFFIIVASMLLSALIIYLLSRSITRPLLQLAGVVRSMPEIGELTRIEIPASDRETTQVTDSINHLLDSLLQNREELRRTDARLQNHLSREPVVLEDRWPEMDRAEVMEGVIGNSLIMNKLKWLIRKAAAVDPDVLIVGETGTGKEVAARSIHALSRRGQEPFISINCGALDENLLLDALFGHVRGAFSEARTDRRGAFLAATGGTLLLDEIGDASPKVQQALLRALSVRAIIPLGSDDELPFDVRVIAATNVDLEQGVRDGTFREDLYYRLRVITLNTPPLRDRMEDVPLLVDEFLREASRVMNKGRLTMSRGAWETISTHDWRGNVRELKHCILRAVAMAENSVIQQEDVRFDLKVSEAVTGDADTSWMAASVDPKRAASPVGGAPGGASAGETARENTRNGQGGERDVCRPTRGKGAESSPSSQKAVIPISLEDLNERQCKGVAYLREHGLMSRAQYQGIVGDNVPPRTAQYDLRDLVERGLLMVKGKGPSTKYVLAPGRV